MDWICPLVFSYSDQSCMFSCFFHYNYELSSLNYHSVFAWPCINRLASQKHGSPSSAVRIMMLATSQDSGKSDLQSIECTAAFTWKQKLSSSLLKTENINLECSSNCSSRALPRCCEYFEWYHLLCLHCAFYIVYSPSNNHWSVLPVIRGVIWWLCLRSSSADFQVKNQNDPNEAVKV